MPEPSLLARATRAAVRPLNLLPAGLGAVAVGGLAVAGLAPFAVAVGALSVGAWGALVALDLAGKPAAPPPPPSAVEGLVSPELRGLLASVEAAGAKVQARVEAHDGAVLSDSLLGVGNDAAGLVEAATRAAVRGDALFRFLSAHDPDAMAKEADERDRAAKKARDEAVARSFTEAAEAKRRELATWRELRALHDRILAELVAVDAALDELHARVVRLSLSDPGNAVETNVAEGLAELRERLGRLERSAEETLREVS